MTLAEFVNTLDTSTLVTIEICVDDCFYSPEDKETKKITTKLFSFCPHLIDVGEYITEDFCKAEINNMKFIGNNTIQIWLDNADEYSLCD